MDGASHVCRIVSESRVRDADRRASASRCDSAAVTERHIELNFTPKCNIVRAQDYISIFFWIKAGCSGAPTRRRNCVVSVAHVIFGIDLITVRAVR
jgi:hypothetical protein